MAPQPDRTAVRSARQHAATSLLLGADALPRRERRTAPQALAEAAIELKPSVASPAHDREQRQKLLDELRERHDRECPHCTGATHHTRTVFGEGDPCARLMFIGEAPGEEEDRTGRPFVGRAGQKLDEMIGAMGLAREQVYIANVLKARPLNNATPTPEEAQRCGPYLLEQVRIVSPEVIVTLGNPATHYVLDTTEGITRARGRWFEAQGIPVMPTFHPAYVLRNYTDDTRRKVWSDLQSVMKRLGMGKKPAG